MFENASKPLDSDSLKAALKHIIKYVKSLPKKSVPEFHLNNLQVLADVIWQCYERRLLDDTDGLKLLTRCLLHIAAVWKNAGYINLPQVQQLIFRHLQTLTTQLLDRMMCFNHAQNCYSRAHPKA